MPSFRSRAYTATPAGSQGLPNGPTPQGWGGAGRLTTPPPGCLHKPPAQARRPPARLTCVTSRVDGRRLGCMRGALQGWFTSWAERGATSGTASEAG